MLTVSGCTLSGNSAAAGGAILNFSGSQLTVSDSAFCANSPDNINGVYTDGSGNTVC
jgi:hypothetical protein